MVATAVSVLSRVENDATFHLLHNLDWHREIPDFPDYWCSKSGRIFSTKKAGRGRGPRFAFLTQRPHPRSGHRRVDLRDARGKRHTVFIHKLVAHAWNGPRPPGGGWEVCHRDGCCSNNHRNNLYYGTRSDNASDRERHARERERKIEACTSVGHASVDSDGFDWSTGARTGFASRQQGG